MYFIRTVISFYSFDVCGEYGLIRVHLIATCCLQFRLGKSGFFSVTLHNSVSCITVVIVGRRQIFAKRFGETQVPDFFCVRRMVTVYSVPALIFVELNRLL